MWNVKKSDKNDLISKQKQTHRDREQTLWLPNGIEGMRERHKLGVWH